MISKKIKSRDNSDHINLDELVQGILSGDRRSLARGITLVESRLSEQVELATKLLIEVTKACKPSRCIAITGPPGVGKSTFIESIGDLALHDGDRLAVLSIDPSSMLTGGSILGDKTRMPKLASHPDAFIRPSPSRGELGGINQSTWEVKKLCEAAGYNLIFIETVGVGQSEIEVSQLADMVTVILQPGSGDDIQSIKKGLNEKADFFIVNKADGDQLKLARESMSFVLANAKSKSITDNSPLVSLHSHADIEMARACWTSLMKRYKELTKNGEIERRRKYQNEYWFHKKSERALMEILKNSAFYKNGSQKYLNAMREEHLPTFEALRSFIAELQKKFNS